MLISVNSKRAEILFCFHWRMKRQKAVERRQKKSCSEIELADSSEEIEAERRKMQHSHKT